MRFSPKLLSTMDKMLVGAIGVLTVVLLGYGLIYKLAVMSADTMHIYTVAADIFRYGHLRGVFFPASPFYFPDIVLSLPVYAFFSNLYTFHAVYFVVLFAAFLLLLYKGLKFSKLQLLLLSALSSIEMIKFTFDSYFYPNHHFGAFVVLLYCFIAIAFSKHRFVVPIILLITVFSDAFCLPWILLPLALYAGGLMLQKSYREAGYIGVCLLMGGLGHLLHLQELSLLGEIHPSMIKASVFPQSMEEFTKNAQLFFEAGGYLMRKNAPLVLILCGLGLMGKALWKKWRLVEPTQRLTFLFLASSLVTMAFLFFTKILIDLSNLRYAMPFIWLPIIYFFYCFPTFPLIIRRMFLVFLLVCQITVLSSYVSAKQTFISTTNARHHCVQEFVTKHRVELAMGDYWNGKLYQFLTDTPTVPVDAELNYYAFATNKNWYVEPVRTRRLRLIFTNNLNAGKISNTFGPPSKTHNCDEIEMWLYEEGAYNPGYLENLLLEIEKA